MSNTPPSHNLEEILAGYVLGDLDEAELLWLQTQIATNPELKEQVTELESTLNLLPYSLPQDLPQGDLRQQILSKAQPKVRAKFSISRYQWGWLVSGITALSTLLLGVNNVGLRQQIARTENQLHQQQELIALLRQPNNRLVSLTANNTNPDSNAIAASGSLFLAPESDMAVLALKNLDPLPGNKVYRLWAVSQGKKTGCSNFKPDAQGEVHLNFTSDDALFAATSVLITIEPRPDTEQPLGQALLSGSYSEI